MERAGRGRGPSRPGDRAALASGAPPTPYNQSTMIYCVIPRELEAELYEKMVDYYRDNPNVTVIVDRRDGPDRRAARPSAEEGAAESRDRRRRRVAGTFPDTDAPPEPSDRLVAGLVAIVAARETFASVSPATGEVLGTFPRSDAADVERAVAAAQAAYEGWRLVPAPKRGEILFRFAQVLEREKDALADLMTHEMGKVKAEAGGDVQEAIDMTSYMAGEGRRLWGQTTPSELRDKFDMSVRVPGRRRRRDHAVELPDRDPVVEARARRSCVATPSCSSRPRTRRCWPSASSSFSTVRACPRASSTSCTATARWPARRSSAIRACR